MDGVNLIFYAVSFLASVIGSICGIGGGVIIKPVLDACGALPVSTIGFLSSCTVFSMSAYSVIKGQLESRKKTAAAAGHVEGMVMRHAEVGGSVLVSGGSAVLSYGEGCLYTGGTKGAASGDGIDLKIGTPLAIGAAIGGMMGKSLYQWVASLFADANRAAAIQAMILGIITVGTLLYTVNKSRIHTLSIENTAVCVLIGLLLGMMSSFLGIGGGPINLVVLYFFFSMSTKTAAQNSLYIIFFSQAASLLLTLCTGVPAFTWPLLCGMILAGVLGGICGRTINKKIDERIVDRLFILLMAVIILINIYNVMKYLGI